MAAPSASTATPTSSHASGRSRLLGGGAYAATRLKENSVGSDQIIDGQVKSADVQNNGITGTDIKEGSLGQVPRAAQAGSADSATNAGNADQLDHKDSTEFALAGSEGWHPAALYDGSGHLVCYWTNFGDGQSDAAYFRDSAGVVHLKGARQGERRQRSPVRRHLRGRPGQDLHTPGGLPTRPPIDRRHSLQQLSGSDQCQPGRKGRDRDRLSQLRERKAVGFPRQHQLPLRPAGGGRLSLAGGAAEPAPGDPSRSTRARLGRSG